MKDFNSFARTALVAGLALLAVPAFADAWDKKTLVTFDQPVEMPTMTLSPGSYTFKLLESSSNRHIVTIWDREGLHHVTTVLAIPNYRMQPAGETAISFWETPAGKPPAMRAWFYPGDNYGQEFAYPKWKAEKLSLASNVADRQVPLLNDRDTAYGQAESTAVAESKPDSSTTTSAEPVTSTPAPSASETQAEAVAVTRASATATPAAVEPEPAPATPAPSAEEPAQAQPEDTPTAAVPADPMPATASHWYDVMLIGILTAVTALATFFGEERRSKSV